jgi:hypothetical protein
MTSRESGQRIAELSQRRGYVTGRPEKQQTKKSGREKRKMAQLIICGVIFISLVTVKLLLPGKMTGIMKSMTSVMDRNMDVTQVFSAIGKAVSGKESFRETLGDVYQAVFHPEVGTALETSADLPTDFGEPSPLAAMHEFAAGAGTCADWMHVEDTTPSGTSDAKAQTTDGSQAVNLSCVLYSDKNLPKNVSLEQAVLGFDYCTPVSGSLTSDFGYREHPIEGEEKFHYGIDIAANTGTPILCFAKGTVAAAGESSSYGKYIIVAHGGGYTTLYAHCSALVVRSGANVSEGQEIAKVGETGLATGPHLHFELHQGSTYLDPIYYVSITRV